MVSPPHKRRAVRHVARQGLCSTRRACRLVGLATSSYYRRPRGPGDRKQRLRDRILALSKTYPRFGYRFIHQLLCREGWTVNRKRVQRIRRLAGLGVRPVRRAGSAPPGEQGVSQTGYPSRPRVVVGFHYGSDRRRPSAEDADDGRRVYTSMSGDSAGAFVDQRSRLGYGPTAGSDAGRAGVYAFGPWA